MNFITHANRFVKAAKMGVLWTGTSRFVLPRKFNYNSRSVSITGPREKSLAWVFRDLVLDDEYGLREIANYPDTIIDIGGNIGLFSLWAGVNFPGAKIHVYEPNPGLLGSLTTNVSQVGATVFSEGVSGQDGYGSFEASGYSMLGQCSGDASGDIKLVSLATAIKRMGGWVDLLKIDCEGAEWEMLNDPKPFNAVGMLRIEYHMSGSCRTLGWMINRLEECGLRTVKVQQNQGFGIAWFER